MIGDFIFSTIEKAFDYKPLDGQKEIMYKLSDFVSASSNSNEIFLMKGYAGTGKTSIIAALVKAFVKLKMKSVLLAPTGRAAKVLSNYSNKEAFTIHKKIYRQRSSSDGFGKFMLDTNLHSNTFFIVDEASMISNQSYENSTFGSGRLLDDLIKYVYNNKGCKLILIGDTAQLPPVKLNISPALDKKELDFFGKDIIEYELTEVIRQAEDSGILFNATNIRIIINEKTGIGEVVKLDNFPKFKLKDFPDISRVNGADLIENITDAYDKYTEKGVAVICRSNKRANRFNQGIRSMILFREDEICAGDLLMIVKNNYFWAEGNKKIDFIANGDTAEIVKIKNYTERYGFRFADVTLKFADYKNLEMDVKVLLDTLHTETPSLNSDQNKDFYYKVEEDFLEIKNKRKRFENIRKSEYFNALQIKYAYAVTCHKAQGGQWDKVFVDQGWVSEEMLNTEYLRWLYTALTRSIEELSLINFRKEFFNEDEMYE